jgi:hypothetical protein
VEIEGVSVGILVASSVPPDWSRAENPEFSAIPLSALIFLITDINGALSQKTRVFPGLQEGSSGDTAGRTLS